MGKKHTYFPPLNTRRTKVRRFILRALVNLFVVVGLGTLFFFAFSYLFDTPAEHQVRQSTEALKREYEALTQRLEEVEHVLDNVEDRDRNVFNMLFESEPYDFGGNFEASRWETAEELMTKTNRELGTLYADKLAGFEGRLSDTDGNINAIYFTLSRKGDSVNYIPSIQPIINKELTLLTASFGQRIQPYYKVLSMHTGVDYTVPEGTRVFATADGTIRLSTSRPSSTGNAIVIDHGNGYETYYNHLSRSIVRQGQKVRRGDIIALTGNTGLSLLPHLHYEIHYNGTPIDPIHYFFAELGPKEYDRMIRIAQSGMQSFD